VHRQLNIQWFGGRASREPSNVVSLEISGAGKPTRHALRNVYSVSSLSLPMQTLGRRDVQGVHKDARLPMKPYINLSLSCSSDWTMDIWDCHLERDGLPERDRMRPQPSLDGLCLGQ